MSAYGLLNVDICICIGGGGGVGGVGVGGESMRYSGKRTGEGGGGCCS